MFGSSRSRRSTSYGVILDVGSGSIGAGIVHSSQYEDIPTILYAHREQIRIGENPSPEERVRAMRQTLFSVILVLSDSGLRALHAYDRHARIGRIVVVCAAPWSKTVTRVVHLKKDKPFTITEDWLHDLITKAQKQNTQNGGRTNDILKGLGMQVVEESIVDIKVNGYTTAEPYGKTGTEVAVAHTTGLLPEDILSAVDEVEENIIMGAEREAHSYALVLYCVLRDRYPDIKNALLIDVTGEATEVGVMRNGILMETAVATHGTFTLMRETARALNTIPEEAKAYIASFKEIGTTDPAYTALAHAAREYETVLEKTLSQLRQRYVLPRTVFLTIDPQVQDYFLSVIKPLHQRLGNHTKPEYRIIGEDADGALVSREEGVNNDAFLSIEARFFHKLHGCTKTDTER